MGHILSHPVTNKNLQRFGDAKMRVGVAEMQGYRTSQEDAHQVLLALPSHASVAYTAVFDGHNGSAAAEWMGANMAARLDALKDPTNPQQLREAVEQADADFMSDTSVRVHGCTALITLITHGANGARKLTVANVGDSRCLIVSSSGQVTFATEDHKPDTEGEARRVRAAGGHVSMGRVDGDLAMSRSIGDYAYKNVAHLGPLEQKVIPTPDISVRDLEPTDVVLVMCDGLVEKLTNQQVASFVHDALGGTYPNSSWATDSQSLKPDQADLDPARIMAALLDWSLQKGSKDNMSSALILPQPGTKYQRADEYRVGPSFAEHSGDKAYVESFLADSLKHGYSHEQTMAMVKERAKEDASAGK